MKILAALALEITLVAACIAQNRADVPTAVYTKLHNAKSLTATMMVSFPGAKPEEWYVKFLKPNLYAIVGTDQQYRFDGKTESQYWPLTGRYQLSQKPQSNAPFAVGLNLFFADVPPVNASATPSQLDGKNVVRLDIKGGRQVVYLDPVSNLPLGYDEQVSSSETLKVRYSDIQLDKPVSPVAMNWSPPANAKPLSEAGGDSKLLVPGTQAPAPTAKTAEGTSFDFSKAFASHKATLVYFWSGAPLPSDVTFLKDTSVQMGDQRLQIVAVEMSGSPSVAKSLAGLPYPVVVDADGSIAKAYGVNGPTEYLVGPDGQIAAHFQGFDPGGIVKTLRQRGFRI